MSRENLWVGTPCSLNCGLDVLQLKERCHNAVDFRSKKHHFRRYKVVSIKGSVHQSDCCLPTPVACPICSSGSCISDHVTSGSVWRVAELQPPGRSLKPCIPMERERKSLIPLWNPGLYTFCPGLLISLTFYWCKILHTDHITDLHR